MAVKKKSTKASATTRRKKNVKFNLHKPGDLPEEQTIPYGTDLEQIKETFALEGYVVSVNGSSVSDDYTVKDGDTIRVGLKTKNN